VHWTQHGQPRPLSATAGLAVYRVVQESLTNTLKHGGPGAGATLHLDWQARGLLVAVSDNGVGGTVAPSTGGHGLVGMRERLAVFGGSVEIGSRPGGGFGVRAWLPYEHTVGRA
jgi:signal transduction histidine kinase